MDEWERSAALNLGVYNDAMERYNKTVESKMLAGDTYLQTRQNVNMQVKEMIPEIREAFRNAGIAWKEGWANIVNSVDPNDLSKVSTLNMDAILASVNPNNTQLYNYIKEYKRIYEGLIHTDLKP